MTHLQYSLYNFNIDFFFFDISPAPTCNVFQLIELSSFAVECVLDRKAPPSLSPVRQEWQDSGTSLVPKRNRLVSRKTLIILWRIEIGTHFTIIPRVLNLYAISKAGNGNGNRVCRDYNYKDDFMICQNHSLVLKMLGFFRL